MVTYIIVAVTKENQWKDVSKKPGVSISQSTVHTEQQVAFMFSGANMLVIVQLQSMSVQKLSITVMLKLSAVKVYADLHYTTFSKEDAH